MSVWIERFINQVVHDHVSSLAVWKLASKVFGKCHKFQAQQEELSHFTMRINFLMTIGPIFFLASFQEYV